MAFNISGLVNNIARSLDNAIGSLMSTTQTGQLYPQGASTKDGITTIKPENWIRLPQPYSFAVYDIVSGDRYSAFAEFQLPLAPSKLTQIEHTATSIKPTQGGTVVSHSPSKYKTLQMSGTTGVAPFRGAGGVDASNGAAIFQPNELKYKSGYEVFHSLRNYFRAYYQLKATDSDTKNLRLVFKNYKDGEFLIVELIDFQMDRQAPRSVLYDYSLQFKVLGFFRPMTEKETESRLAQFERNLKLATQKIDNARGVFLRSQVILRQIEATYDSVILEPLRKMNLSIKAFQGIGPTAADMGDRAIRKTITATAALGILHKVQDMKSQAAISTESNATLDRVTLPNDLAAASKLAPADVIIGLQDALFLLNPEDFPQTTQTELSRESAESQTLPRNFYEDSLAQLERVKDNAEDFFGLGSDAYDAMFDRVTTIGAEPGKIITDEEFDVLAAFNEAAQAIQSVLATDTLFKSSFDDRIKSVISSFENQIQLQALPAVQQIIMPAQTDLERLAQVYLGDSTRWVEIAELNDLRAPFVVQNLQEQMTNVVYPGKPILIPSPPKFGFSKLPSGKEITSGPNLSQLEKSLGTDLKLTPDFDLSLGNNGDLQIIRGADNVSQAVVLKLGYERGELIRNPSIGASLGVGRKFPALATIKDDLIQTLTQDPRIDKLENVELQRNGPELRISFQIKIKQVDIPVPVIIKVT